MRTAQRPASAYAPVVRLETRHLEVLLTIEESGSIRGAARKLGVDQPQVSRQLRRIEQRLATTVFVRGTRGVTATAPGLRVLTLARRAMGVLDEINRPATELDRSAPESLRVLYDGLPAIAILDGLAVRYPALQAQFGSTTPFGAFAELRAGRAEVFLGVWLPHVRWPAAEAIAVVNVLADPMHVHLAADHPLAAQAELRLSDLVHEPWIAGSRTTVTQECRLVGGFEPRLAHRVTDESTASTLLAQGRGVMLGSSVTPRTDGVVRRPYRGRPPSTGCRPTCPAGCTATWWRRCPNCFVPSTGAGRRRGGPAPRAAARTPVGAAGHPGYGPGRRGGRGATAPPGGRPQLTETRNAFRGTLGGAVVQSRPLPPEHRVAPCVRGGRSASSRTLPRVRIRTSATEGGPRRRSL